ncbi:MAG: SRPBCC family protein [Janthinobacterium lividum]
MPIPLPLIFRAGRGIPAITGTSVVTPWDAVGQARRVFFASGDSAREEITHYERGRYFAYRVSEFTLAAKYVAKYAVGEWWWSATAGQTTIRWRYTFVPKNRLVRPLLALFIRYRWRPYMQAAMGRVQQDAAQQLSPASAPAR